MEDQASKSKGLLWALGACAIGPILVYGVIVYKYEILRILAVALAVLYSILKPVLH